MYGMASASKSALLRIRRSLTLQPSGRFRRIVLSPSGIGKEKPVEGRVSVFSITTSPALVVAAGPLLRKYP
jgi:hypothetical protein